MSRCVPRFWFLSALRVLCSLLLSPAVDAQRLAESARVAYNDPTAPGVLARAADLDDGVLAVASTSGNSGSSNFFDRVFIFDEADGGWAQIDVVQGSGYQNGEEFGSDVGVAGPLMAVGSKTDRDLGLKSGSVYLFERQAGVWLESQKLYASDGGLNGFFGEKLTVSADSGVERIAVGSRNPARVYIFERDPSGLFSETARLVLDDDSVYEVELAGDRMAVGTERAVYVFELDAGDWQQQLEYRPGGFAGLDIGFSGDVLGTRIRVGANWTIPLFSPDASGENWQQFQTITDPDAGQAELADFELDGDRMLLAVKHVGEAFGSYLDVGLVYERDSASGLYELETRLVAKGMAGKPFLFFAAAMDGRRMALVETLTDEMMIYEDREPSALAVELDGPAFCASGGSGSFFADAGGFVGVHRLDSWIDDGSEVLECMDCGFNADVAFDRDLDSCEQDVEVTVLDQFGSFAWDGVTVRHDDRAPSIFCSDREVSVPFGAGGAIVNTSSNGRDDCDGVIPATCDVPRGFLPVGVTTVNCSVADQCGNTSSCSFQVAITETEPLPPGPGCSDSLFTGQIDPVEPPAPWQWAALGDGALIPPVVDDRGLVVSGTGTSMYHSGDHGMFVYRSESSQNFRIEIPVPSQVEDAGTTYQKGGAMVRYGLGSQALRVMAMLLPDHPNGPSIQFDVRRTAGQPAVELASTRSATTVTHVAIEKDGIFFRVEYSEDYGATWRQPAGGLGGETVLNNPTGDALIGLATASYDGATEAAFAVPRVRHCGEIGD